MTSLCQDKLLIKTRGCIEQLVLQFRVYRAATNIGQIVLKLRVQ